LKFKNAAAAVLANQGWELPLRFVKCRALNLMRD
jgi:hypothetical protein